MNAKLIRKRGKACHGFASSGGTFPGKGMTMNNNFLFTPFVVRTSLFLPQKSQRKDNHKIFVEQVNVLNEQILKCKHKYCTFLIFIQAHQLN